MNTWNFRFYFYTESYNLNNNWFCVKYTLASLFEYKKLFIERQINLFCVIRRGRAFWIVVRRDRHMCGDRIFSIKFTFEDDYSRPPFTFVQQYVLIYVEDNFLLETVIYSVKLSVFSELFYVKIKISHGYTCNLMTKNHNTLANKLQKYSIRLVFILYSFYFIL